MTDERLRDDDFIFRSCITLKNGRKLFAHEVGLRAFKIPIRSKAND